MLHYFQTRISPIIDILHLDISAHKDTPIFLTRPFMSNIRAAIMILSFSYLKESHSSNHRQSSLITNIWTKDNAYLYIFCCLNLIDHCKDDFAVDSESRFFVFFLFFFYNRKYCVFLHVFLNFSGSRLILFLFTYLSIYFSSLYIYLSNRSNYFCRLKTYKILTAKSNIL